MPTNTCNSNNHESIIALPQRICAPLKIVLAEDNEGDIELMRLALDKINIPYTLKPLHKGSDVLPYLTCKNRPKAPSPDLLLLDLGLPEEDGFEILAQITRMRGAIHDIPIVILTAYEHFSYLKKFELCITDYLVKPCNIDALRQLMFRLRPQLNP